jgi:hypothetical protein
MSITLKVSPANLRINTTDNS